MKKIFAAFMIMVMVLTASAPVVTEAKTTIKVTNKATGRKVGKKVTLTAGEKLQLKVTYGKKNVTKKAKYKASSGRIKVSKKGKITAKSAGTCTVKVSYKKMSKKIKVVVKDGKEQTLEEERTEAVTEEEKTAEETKIKKKKNASKAEIKEYMEQCKIQTDPHPECEHEWETEWYRSDVYLDGEDIFEWFKHMTLVEIRCRKCETSAIVSPVSDVKTAESYTSEELAELILYYDGRYPTGNMQAPEKPKHKCKKEYGCMRFINCGHNLWERDNRCPICGMQYDE